MTEFAQGNQRLVQAFFARWERSFEELCASLSILADDCLWRQSGLPDVVGSAAAVELVQGSRRRLGVETVRVDILKIITDQKGVASERIDHLLRADRSLIVSISVVGVMEVAGGKILGWREYFDTSILKP